ncbi:MAG: site-specific integrase [Rikenellaceae bacterium]
MASIKIKFRSSKVNDKEGAIYYQVIHNRKVRQISTDYKLFENEWFDLFSKLYTPSYGNRREIYLSTLYDRVKAEVRRIEHIIDRYEGRIFDVDDIVSAAERLPKGVSLRNFMYELIHRLKELGRTRTAETYISTLNSVMNFLQGEDISIDMIDSDMMERYEAFLKRRESTLNTISFYMRTLRATYNRAVEKGFVEQKYPFKRVYTNLEKTAKRAISLSVISQIKQLELTHKPHLEFARDLFIFSFYTRGMSFIDIAYLRKRDIKGDELSYRRRKTGQRLNIKWESCMRELVDRHPNKNTEYLLPIISNPDVCHRKQYLKGIATINRHLGKIAAMVGLPTTLTMYVARHSWASAAKHKNIPISVISEGMGHDNETTTQIYLASLDTSVIDEANRLIMDSI